MTLNTGFGLASVKMEALQDDPLLRQRLKRQAATGSHPNRELVKIIEALENEEATKEVK